MRIITLSSLGEGPREYELKHDWSHQGVDISVQGGGSGIVISGKDTYTTAFFEAFPKSPSCFVRGEGKNIEEAEQHAWLKYLTIRNCPRHEFERRNRKDGYGFCIHCSYSGMVFESLMLCVVCKKPTRYTERKGKNYCKKHSINLPIDTDEKYKFFSHEKERVPRKDKKKIKIGFVKGLAEKGLNVKVKDVKKTKSYNSFKASGYHIGLYSRNQIRSYIQRKYYNNTLKRNTKHEW